LSSCSDWNGKGEADEEMDLVMFFFIALGLSMDALAGHKFGSWIAGKVEIIGGLILMAYGFKILPEHLRQR
jgi:putative Mn2+ efflux pump MntP